MFTEEMLNKHHMLSCLFGHMHFELSVIPSHSSCCHLLISQKSWSYCTQPHSQQYLNYSASQLHVILQKSGNLSSHFWFPRTQTDQATSDTVRYIVLIIWQKNETGKFSIAGNNEALLLSIFLSPTEGSLCDAAKLPLITTGTKSKVGEKFKMISKKHEPVFTLQHTGKSLDAYCINSWYANLRSSHKIFTQNKQLLDTCKEGLHKINCFQKKGVPLTQVLHRRLSKLH